MIPIRLVRTVACPRCAAGAHEVCRRKDGSLRGKSHRSRVKRFIELYPWNHLGEW